LIIQEEKTMNLVIALIIFAVLAVLILFLYHIIVKSPTLPDGIPNDYRELYPHEFLNAGDIAVDGDFAYVVKRGDGIFKAGECTERFFRKV
jgi:hypothetical protein